MIDSIADCIRGVVPQVTCDGASRTALQLIGLLIDDRRHIGRALWEGLDHATRLATANRIDSRGRVDILLRLADDFGLRSRLGRRVERAADSQEAVTRLRRLYPWPLFSPPDVEADESASFLTASTADTLDEVLRIQQPKLIVEIGSWVGKSTKWMFDRSQATIICIDSWLGSVEHQSGSDWHERDSRNQAVLARLFDQFVRNRWDERERIVPMRTTSIAGLWRLFEMGVRPDFIFVDGAHDAVTVATELHLLERFFPAAIVVVDDYAPGER
jgi:hypothetical protein